MNWIVLSAVAHFRRWIARNGAFAAGLLIPLVIAYGAALKAHMKRSSSPFVFNEDVRQQIFPFFQYHEAGLFPHDYFGPYFRACFLPPGYRALYRFGAIVADPAGISKVLPYFLLVATVIAVAVAARPLAGYFGALLAAALVVQSDILLDRMVGGLPRAFAFPTLALTATALVWGRPRLLAGIVCASASFYPVAAVPGAIALMLWLFVLPARDRGEAANWCLARRTRLAIVTASISALILLPMLVGARAYGRTLGPSDVIEYPEIANGGRYGTETIVPPFETFAKAAFELARRLFTPVGEPWLKNVREWAKTRAQSGTNSNGDVVLELVTVALLVGGVLVVTQGPAGRRFFLLGAAAWLGHLAARWLAPYFFLPQRYVMYPVPILLVVLIPAAGAAIGAQLSSRRLTTLGHRVGVIAIAAMVLLPFGGRGSRDAGLNVDVKSQQRLYNFLGHLPKDVMIAGWPTDVDNVPYVSRRQAFITYELHQAFHQGYADEMRRRMRALIDAYFATDQGALKRLRDEFGVTHLVFRQSRLGKPPHYFEPFSACIQKAFEDGRGKGFEIQRQVDAAMVFSDGPLVVLDLRRLSTP